MVVIRGNKLRRATIIEHSEFRSLDGMTNEELTQGLFETAWGIFEWWIISLVIGDYSCLSEDECCGLLEAVVIGHESLCESAG